MPKQTAFTEDSIAARVAPAQAAGVAALLAPSKRVLGANDRVRVGVCGIRGQGFQHIEEYSRMPNVQVTAVCDVDQNVIRQRLYHMELLGLPKPVVYTDVRKMIEDQSIDAVSIAAPNHWHALMAIWACQGGKDVYLEKPASHHWWEGRQIVRAAEKYDRLVQHGTNSRSNPAVIEGIRKMREGLIGDVYLSRGLCFKSRNTIGHAAEEPVPAGVDYEMWTGPAARHAFTQNRFHYNWHWFWDYGNGDLGNQGIHEIDLARWGLGVDLPDKVSAMGGHYLFDDDQETPNTLLCTFQFTASDGARRMMEMEVRHGLSNHEAEIGTAGMGGAVIPGFMGAARGDLALGRGGDTIGALYYGSKGYMAITDMDDGEFQSYRTWMGREQAPGPAMSTRGNNWANFIACVRDRKKENLNAPIQEAHKSCTLLHLANASYRLGRTIHFDPAKEAVIGDAEAEVLLRGQYRHPFTVPETV